MRICKDIEETRAECRAARAAGKRIGFVPTMGALHDGHLALVRTANTQSDFVVVSVFVNPTQFGPNEDFAKYPRAFERDRELLAAENVHLIFAPTVEAMYPPGASTIVHVEGLSERLDGKSRPGHFRGVATVVTKLFHAVEPDRAFFGQKDAAQVAVIRRMTRDLDFPIEIVVVPTVRESDGLALSSRNAYLDPTQRKQATVLYRALTRIQFLADRGERSSAALLEAGRSVLAEEPQVRIDFLEIVDSETLEPVSDVSHGALVAAAAFVGTTRLIDNIMLLGSGGQK